MEHGTGAGPAWTLALEHSALGKTMRQAMWLYPIANVLHVLAVVAMIGSILAFDLRLMGTVKSCPWPVGAVAAADLGWRLHRGGGNGHANVHRRRDRCLEQSCLCLQAGVDSARAGEYHRIPSRCVAVGGGLAC